MYMQKGLVGTSWDDAYYKDGLLKKGERRKKPTKPEIRALSETERNNREPMRCGNCGLLYSFLAKERCSCPPWTVGKTLNAGTI